MHRPERLLHEILGSAAITGQQSGEAEQAWVTMLEGNSMPLLGMADCTPGYYNKEGGELTRADRLNVSGYPAGPAAFFDFIDGWRASGDFEGLEFR